MWFGFIISARSFVMLTVFFLVVAIGVIGSVAVIWFIEGPTDFTDFSGEQ